MMSEIKRVLMTKGSPFFVGVLVCLRFLFSLMLGIVFVRLGLVKLRQVKLNASVSLQSDLNT